MGGGHRRSLLPSQQDDPGEPGGGCHPLTPAAQHPGSPAHLHHASVRCPAHHPSDAARRSPRRPAAAPGRLPGRRDPPDPARADAAPCPAAAGGGQQRPAPAAGLAARRPAAAAGAERGPAQGGCLARAPPAAPARRGALGGRGPRRGGGTRLRRPGAPHQRGGGRALPLGRGPPAPARRRCPPSPRLPRGPGPGAGLRALGAAGARRRPSRPGSAGGRRVPPAQRPPRLAGLRCAARVQQGALAPGGAAPSARAPANKPTPLPRHPPTLAPAPPCVAPGWWTGWGGPCMVLLAPSVAL